MRESWIQSRGTSVFLKLFTLWLWGGFVYYVIELLWRGYSHESMYIVGGICFLMLGRINKFLPWDMPLPLQCIIGGVGVTLIEFVAGVILNLWLGLGIWDYSYMPLNIMGQVCVYFVFMWTLLSLPGICLDDYLCWKLYNDERPRYTWWWKRKAG